MIHLGLKDLQKYFFSVFKSKISKVPLEFLISYSVKKDYSDYGLTETIFDYFMNNIENIP